MLRGELPEDASLMLVDMTQLQTSSKASRITSRVWTPPTSRYQFQHLLHLVQGLHGG